MLTPPFSVYLNAISPAAPAFGLTVLSTHRPSMNKRGDEESTEVVIGGEDDKLRASTLL